MASARARATRWAWPPESWRGRCAGDVAEPDPLEPIGRLPPGFGPGDVPGPQAERDVLEDAEVGEEQMVLEHHADVAVLGRHPDVGGRVFDRPARR